METMQQPATLNGSAPARSGAINLQFSGSIPANYDDHLGPLFFEPFARHLIERIVPFGAKDVLELACGTGRLTRHLADRHPERTRIVATDVNPAMLAHAKALITDREITWEAVDAVSLPYPAASFDLVVAQFGVMFYSDRITAYKEALRVLRPGGRLLFTCWNALEMNPAAHITQKVIAAQFPLDTPAFYTVPFAYHDRAVIREEVLLAGFERVHLEEANLKGEAVTAEAAAKGLLEGSPIHTAIMDRDAFALPAMREALTEQLKARFGAKDLRVPLNAWVVEASKR